MCIAAVLPEEGNLTGRRGRPAEHSLRMSVMVDPDLRPRAGSCDESPLGLQVQQDGWRRAASSFKVIMMMIITAQIYTTMIFSLAVRV